MFGKMRNLMYYLTIGGIIGAIASVIFQIFYPQWHKKTRFGRITKLILLVCSIIVVLPMAVCSLLRGRFATCGAILTVYVLSLVSVLSPFSRQPAANLAA